MAAGEDKPETIVFAGKAHLNFALVMVVRDSLDLIKKLLFVVASRPCAARVVDQLAMSGSCDPRGRVFRNALHAPACERSGECILHGLFCEVEGMRDADEAG